MGPVIVSDTTTALPEPDETTTTSKEPPTTTPCDETTVNPETTTSPTTPAETTTLLDVSTTAATDEDDYEGEDQKGRENTGSKSAKNMVIITATTPKIDVKIDTADSDSDFSENYGQNLRSFANWAQESWNGENTFKIDLFTIDGTTLLGNLTLGSPPITVRVTFDQTTFTTWVTGYHCVYSNGVTCFTQIHKYDPTLSYTATFLNRSMTLDYGNAMAKGEFVQELVVLGTQMSSSFPMFCNIGVANRLDTFFRDVLLDGVVGLAFPPANQTGFLEFLLHAQIFQKPIFSIWLNPRRNLTSDLVAGTIVFGRADKKNCGNVIGSARVVNRPLWEFKIDNITLNNFLIRREINAILDMGSSHIFVPKMDLAKIKKILKLKNTVRIPCKKYMKLVVRSNRTRLIMKTNNLMRFLERKKTKNYCNLEIREGAGDVWILGATFFRRFCVIHNFLKGIIGFAEHLD